MKETFVEKDFSDATLVVMPRGAICRHVGLQDKKVFLWAEVETDSPNEHRVFFLLGTGFSLADASKAPTYIGTTMDGPFVWHLYEVNQ